ncbi:MAG: dihydroorotate dehydrogenase [Spirochaetaceae bacterium]|jgi:dihydroorotate dehydrogenase (NAD+) catalytic subunit|nr:dihydroorotate dehydrogenase [Spirochaetaceae bacterium]
MPKTDEQAPDLSVCIAGVHFRNPVIAASGTFGYGREYEGLLDIACLGGICTKGLTLHPRPGNTGPRLYETPSGLLNSIGLENPGIPAFIEQELPALRALGPVVIANLSGSSLEEYQEGARLLSQAPVDLIEINISCPNVRSGGMAFGLDPGLASSVVRAVRKVLDKPLMVKLSPNAPDLPAVACSCAEAGADALSLVNTFQGMAIDIYRRKPVFHHIKAGLSGPGIRPLALRMVWDLWETVPLPLVGLGGIACPEDALEFLLAGAVAVQIGSATFAHPPLMPEIIRGIERYMRRFGISRLADLSIREPPGQDR